MWYNLIMKTEANNYAYIDGQNLYMGTTKREIDPFVDFLITESKFEKIIFPDSKRASSLYKKLGAPYFAALDNIDTKRKIEMKKAP